MPLRFCRLAPKLTSRRPTTTTTTSTSPSDVPIPNHFRCPISLDLMKDPVTLPTGITYDRRSIETWLEAGNLTCPLTNQLLPLPLVADGGLIPNHTIRRMIQEWCVAHRSHGIERIPTPKTPITSIQVAETLSEISAALLRGDGPRCSDLVAKLKTWSNESERNRRCISSNGAAARVVSEVFKEFPSEQGLSVLAGMLPLSEEARKLLSSTESLNSIVSVMRNGNLSGRLHAVLMVKEIAAADTEQAAQIAATDGLIESIVRLVKEPFSPQATKASLVAAYYLVSSDEKVASRFAEIGFVTVLLDMLVDAQKNLCEKGLVVIDGVLNSEIGREKASSHALTVPLLVKKMFRVSDITTEFAVSAIWKLCKNQKNNVGREKCLKEAMQFGAFQKLLLLLQVGCSDNTKEKASELLRMLNGLKGTEECIETSDFKQLKRSF
ncbi:U-box domain-containing protein 21-like [Dendrobium catenatum]|uniref:U-box domain-containing protein n=1 Tax=Dendrobium catenatum TaxID=906689 RepID=A0A2I0WQU0_9ASPA|nr:U-box domain-containing protein 21-like [Dendrobium catenatum]PKU78019.1 U-box domain-containing protein 21 [Dendrobium catenatum]